MPTVSPDQIDYFDGSPEDLEKLFSSPINLERAYGYYSPTSPHTSSGDRNHAYWTKQFQNPNKDMDPFGIDRAANRARSRNHSKRVYERPLVQSSWRGFKRPIAVRRWLPPTGRPTAQQWDKMSYKEKQPFRRVPEPMSERERVREKEREYERTVANRRARRLERLAKGNRRRTKRRHTKRRRTKRRRA